ncbi:MAG: DMT family transporter [Chloroflexia bacterium]
MSPKARAYLALLLGISIIPWGAILIRWAREAPALVIAAGRVTIAALLCSPFALARGVPAEIRALGRRQWLLALASGIALALHFAAWVSSVQMTTIASSTVLVSTYPFFVGLFQHFFLRERVSRLTAVGIGLAFLGSVLIGYGDFGLSQEALLGDLLALTGALMASVYFVLGRALRQRLSLLTYIWPVYSVAALTLIAIGGSAGQSFWGYSARTYGMLLLLAVGPQLLGHSSLNYALGQLSAVFVTVAALAEPIGAAVLAFLLMHEAPGRLALLGALLILAGIVLAGREEQRTDRTPGHLTTGAAAKGS